MKSFLERFAWLQIKRKNTFNQIDRHLRSSNLSSKKLLADLTDLLALLEAKSMEFPTDSSQWLPYKLRLERSGIENAGLGVHLEGMIEKGSIVALYPGTIYHPGDPLFLSSLRNAYILRCFDGLFVDGKHFGLSASVFESMYKFHCGCCGEVVADNSWLKHSKTMVKNPLAVGQIINNGTLKFPANVHYHELDLPLDFPLHLRRWIPNVCYSRQWNLEDQTRIVLILSNKEIKNEELFSSYYEEVS